jgi:hypothetical protein
MLPDSPMDLVYIAGKNTGILVVSRGFFPKIGAKSAVNTRGIAFISVSLQFRQVILV